MTSGKVINVSLMRVDTKETPCSQVFGCSEIVKEGTKVEKINDRGISHKGICTKSESAVLASMIALKRLFWTCPECLRVVSLEPFDPILDKFR